ncbi:exported hypothetical protein [Candidatus Sulfopaludibacter sp. SbA4]|nr:exported hypothetical protein [Candidatus Sulfopaludibacter sp. SbA4]
MKSRWIITISGVLLAAAAVAVLPNLRVHAQPGAPLLTPHPFAFFGYQANESAPFQVQGDLIGENAVWQRLVGPILSSVFATIPPGTGFPGAPCQAEYSQDQIVAQDGTIQLQVFGFRCTPSPDPNFKKTAVYSITGGTGKFLDIVCGTGSILFDHHADGSVRFVASGTEWNGIKRL